MNPPGSAPGDSPSWASEGQDFATVPRLHWFVHHGIGHLRRRPVPWLIFSNHLLIPSHTVLEQSPLYHVIVLFVMLSCHVVFGYMCVLVSMARVVTSHFGYWTRVISSQAARRSLFIDFIFNLGNLTLLRSSKLNLTLLRSSGERYCVCNLWV